MSSGKPDELMLDSIKTMSSHVRDITDENVKLRDRIVNLIEHIGRLEEERVELKKKIERMDTAEGRRAHIVERMNEKMFGEG